MDDSQRLQVALGKVRRASGDFQGRLLAIDPHRVRSFSKRHMRRHRKDKAERNRLGQRIVAGTTATVLPAEATPESTAGLRCRKCGHQRFRVIYTRPATGRVIRRRACLKCEARITTVERVMGG